MTDAERKQRQRAKERAEGDEVERVRLAAEAKAKLIAEMNANLAAFGHPGRPSKNHDCELEILKGNNRGGKRRAQEKAPLNPDALGGERDIDQTDHEDKRVDVVSLSQRGDGHDNAHRWEGCEDDGEANQVTVRRVPVAPRGAT